MIHGLTGPSAINLAVVISSVGLPTTVICFKIEAFARW